MANWTNEEQWLCEEIFMRNMGVHLNELARLMNEAVAERGLTGFRVFTWQNLLDWQGPAPRGRWSQVEKNLLREMWPLRKQGWTIVRITAAMNERARRDNLDCRLFNEDGVSRQGKKLDNEAASGAVGAAGPSGSAQVAPGGGDDDDMDTQEAARILEEMKAASILQDMSRGQQ